MMPIKTPGLAAFHKHKSRAAKIGVKFLFTFEQWRAWWETNLGSDWLKKRGIRRGQYHMARFGDKGPYSPENVKCILGTENCTEQNHPDCEDSPGAKLTLPQVLEIRSNYRPFCRENGCHALGEKYGVSHSTISLIIRGERWRSQRAGWKEARQ